MSFEHMKSAVAARAGLSKAQTDQALTAFIEHLQTSLVQGEKISLPGVGQFEVADRYPGGAEVPPGVASGTRLESASRWQSLPLAIPLPCPPFVPRFASRISLASRKICSRKTPPMRSSSYRQNCIVVR